jgi:hypothetical protein
MVSRRKLQPSNFRRLTIADRSYGFLNIKKDTASGTINKNHIH